MVRIKNIQRCGLFSSDFGKMLVLSSRCCKCSHTYYYYKQSCFL